MKYLTMGMLVILHLITARPQERNNTRIVSYKNINDGTGNFNIAFQTSNGITQQQVGELKNINSTTNATIMKGLFSVITPNNTSSSSSLITKSLDSEDQVGVAVVNTENQNSTQNEILSQTDLTPSMLNIGNATGGNSTNQTASKEFPDRIGTPAIITLMGPPG